MVLPEISNLGLILAFLPVLVVVVIMARWRAAAGTAIYASLRMLIQLLLVGYVLIYVFETDEWLIITIVLVVMLTVASWIAIRPLATSSVHAYFEALGAITVGAIFTLGLVTQFVVSVEPWFNPRYVVPLAGMIIAGSMNAVSLAAERFEAESSRGVDYIDARRTALQTALIPIVNSLFAVGVVALPGMMTGQILSGVSPLIAAKYQIVVMTMLFGASGISAAVFLTFQQRKRRN